MPEPICRADIISPSGFSSTLYPRQAFLQRSVGYSVFQLIAAVIAAYLTIYFKGEANPTVSNLGLLKSIFGGRISLHI